MSVGDRDASADNAIGAQILWGHRPPRRTVQDIDRVAIPGDPPSDRVQWDEATGRWIQWNEDDQAWDEVELDEPIVAGPADPGATPSEPTV